MRNKMTKDSSSLAGKIVDIRERVYWNSDRGMQHGFIRNRKGPNVEVYNYADGMLVLIQSKDIEKEIKEMVE